MRRASSWTPSRRLPDSGMNIVVIELLVVVLPVLAFAIWEYVKVSRELEQEKHRDEES